MRTRLVVSPAEETAMILSGEWRLEPRRTWGHGLPRGVRFVVQVAFRSTPPLRAVLWRPGGNAGTMHLHLFEWEQEHPRWFKLERVKRIHEALDSWRHSHTLGAIYPNDRQMVEGTIHLSFAGIAEVEAREFPR